MEKTAVIQKIISTLQAELETYTRAAKASHAEATAEENRAENKYDTRGLEASYLAAGQANKVAELEDSIAAFEQFIDRQFAKDEPIDLGALIEITQEGDLAHYFIGPSAGGTEIEIESTEILIITPQSLLGTQLLGKTQGDKTNIKLAGQSQSVEIVSVA